MRAYEFIIEGRPPVPLKYGEQAKLAILGARVRIINTVAEQHIKIIFDK
jgi:hypothetical protein